MLTDRVGMCCSLGFACLGSWKEKRNEYHEVGCQCKLVGYHGKVHDLLFKTTQYMVKVAWHGDKDVEEKGRKKKKRVGKRKERESKKKTRGVK